MILRIGLHSHTRIRLNVYAALITRLPGPFPEGRAAVFVSSCPFRDIGNRTFRRHGLHFSARRGRRGDAMEGEFCDGRTDAVCDPAQGWGDNGFAVPGVRYLT